MIKRDFLMYQRVVMTAGISLLNSQKECLDKKFSSMLKSDQRLTEKTEKKSDLIVEYILENLLKDSEKQISQTSAELSLISTLKKQNSLIDKPYITLFHTDTFFGRTAGVAVKKVLENVYSATVRRHEIYELDVTNRSILNRSLGKYLSDLSQALQEGEPNTTCFSPLGGYKVMTSLGYLVGAMHNFPTIYLHEGTNVIHKIPAVKIDINESVIQENHQLLKKFVIGNCFEIESLSQAEKELVKQHPMMFDQIEGLVELNPFGRYLCEQDHYYKFFKPKVKLERSLKHKIDRNYPGSWEQTYSEIDSLIFHHQSDSKVYKSELYHERNYSQLRGRKLLQHLYKGKNKPMFRALWFYKETEDCYYISYIWFDHEQYEREVEDQIVKDPSQYIWEDITDDLYG